MIQKHKYLTLDAIRGLAALFVLTIHFKTLFGGMQFPHAGMAVDLFFIMSGFVISAAYDQNIISKKLAVIDFLKIRAIRLYPLYFLALSIAWMGKYRYSIDHEISINWIIFFTEALFGLLLIPSPVSGNVLFPLNPPSWSIFFEIIANGLYAKFRLSLTNKMLLNIMAAAGAMLILSVLAQHNINFGFSWKNGIGGLPRVIYSFAAGLMIHRTRLNLKFRNQNSNLMLLLVLLIVALLLGFQVTQYTELYELIVVLVVFPFLVLLATFVEPSPNSKLEIICAVMGLTSYAIYILQVPFISAFPEIYLVPGYAAVAVLFFVSWLIDLYFDQPVRRWMRRKFLDAK